MIQPADIRTGNWVLRITGQDNKSHSYFEYTPVAINEYYYTFSKFCFPVHLSSAVLGSCGFKHEFGDWYLNIDAEGIDDGLPFLRFKHADQTWYLHDIKIPAQPIYLHQLQNLYYALCKKELKVDLGLFKNTETMGPINFFTKPYLKTYQPLPLL